MEAIHTATIQVLLAEGAARLTTTRVAIRAGVSIGTMYQYYPHKQALLFAIVERQLQTVEDVLVTAAERLAGCDMRVVAQELATAWLDAKTANPDPSRAIYGVAADFDISALMELGVRRRQEAVVRLLTTLSDVRFVDPEATGFMLLALMAGSTRAVLERGALERDMANLRRELPLACFGYLSAARCADGLTSGLSRR